MFYLSIGLFSLANSNDVLNFSIRCLLCFFVGFFADFFDM